MPAINTPQTMTKMEKVQTDNDEIEDGLAQTSMNQLDYA